MGVLFLCGIQPSDNRLSVASFQVLRGELDMQMWLVVHGRIGECLGLFQSKDVTGIAGQLENG